MSAGSLAILADYEDDDTDADDTSNQERKAYGSHLRGMFTISQDGRCPRCETNNVLFVILDELFPTGDMPEILYTLIAKGKAVLWSSQDKKGCKAPPTFLCRGFCPPDPLGAGFNINWSMNTLKDIFFSAKTMDILDPAEDHINSQSGIYNQIDESGNKDEDVQESAKVSNNNDDEDNENEEDEEEEDDDDDEIDEDELIKQMLAKEAMKTHEDEEADLIQPSVTSEITETETEHSDQTSFETKTTYYTPSSADATDIKDEKSDDSTPVIHTYQSSGESNKSHQYPVSSDGTCPFCTSTNVQYIIVCSSDLQDKDLPYTLRELLKRDQAFKMAKGANDPPSFLCRSCQYGFNLDWSITNLELIFGIPKKPSKKHTAAALGAAPHMGYPPPRVPPANVPPPSLPPRGFPPPYSGIPPPAVPPPGLAPPGTFQLPPPRIPPPRVPPPYSHVPPRHTPPPAYPPRIPPPAGYVRPGIPPPPGQASPQLPPHVPRLPPTPPRVASPMYPLPGSSPHLPRVPPVPPRVPPPLAGQYPGVPPRYPTPMDYQYGYQQHFRPPGYPPVQAGYHGYPGYGHTNPYYPPQGPTMPPPGQLPYQQPPYYQLPTAGYPPMQPPGYPPMQPPGYPPMQPPGYQQPPAPGTQYYPPTRPPTSRQSSYHRTHYLTYPERTSEKDTEKLTVEEKENEDKEKDQVVDDEKFLEDSNRFEELLNQIDHSRGITSSERSTLDVDLSQNEPNSISEEHGDTEYDERPPGDDFDDTTPEFEKVPSDTKKLKSKVESEEPITNLESSSDATMETQETSSIITEPLPNDTEEDTTMPCQNQAEESEEAMETSEETVPKEMVVKQKVSKKNLAKKTPKGRRGRKRKAAEEPQEEIVTKQPKVTDESSQDESEEVKQGNDDAVGAQQKLIEESSKDESEEPVMGKLLKPNARRGRRKRATNQSKLDTKDEVPESKKIEEERKETISSEIAIPEPLENEQMSEQEVDVKTVKSKARRSRKVEEETESSQSSGMEAAEIPLPTSTRQRRGRSQGGLPDKDTETVTTQKADSVTSVTSTRQRRGRSQKDQVEKESESELETAEFNETNPETSINEDQNSSASATGRRRGRPQQANKTEAVQTNVEVTLMETDDTAATTTTACSITPDELQHLKMEDKNDVKDKEDTSGIELTDSQPSDMEAPAAIVAPTRRKRGRSLRGSSKKDDPTEAELTDTTEAEPTDSQPSDMEAPAVIVAPAGRKRGRSLRGSSKKDDTTEAESTDATEAEPTDSQPSDMKAPAVIISPAGRKRGRSLRGPSKKDDPTEAESTDMTETEPTDSQPSDMEVPAVIVDPAGRKRGRSLRGSSKKDDTTVAEPSDSQQSDVEPEAVGSIAATRRRSGKSLKGSSKKVHISTVPEPVSQGPAATPLDEHNSSDVDQQKRDNDSSTSQVEEQSTEEVVGKKPTRRQSSDINKDDVTIKNKGKKTRTKCTGDTSADIETSNKEKSNVLRTKPIRKTSLHKDESTEASDTADDATASSVNLESAATPTRGHKITPARKSRVFRKRN